MADLAPKPGAERSLQAMVAALNACYGNQDALSVLKLAVDCLYLDDIAIVSSFGADSAIMLHMVSIIKPDVPVIFLDTGKHFGETRSYRDTLVEEFGLEDVRSIRPDPARLKDVDPAGNLFLKQPDLCCHVRKTEIMEDALKPFTACLTGRKRFQTSDRKALPVFEADGLRVKVNPIANWSLDEVKAYCYRHDLPPHPLVEQGFPSIGCMPCTSPVKKGEDLRAGRWRGSDKTECGIHIR